MQAVQTPLVTDHQVPRKLLGESGYAVFALVLALLTGFTLGQVTLVGGNTFEKRTGSSTEATRLGLEFYDAVGVYLATGKTPELNAVVAPDFVDHVDGRPSTTGAETLLDQLRTLREFANGAELTATPVSSSGELVRFSVAMKPEMRVTVLGLPVTQGDTSTFEETLRIAGGRVAERWSTLQPPPTAKVLASTVRDPPPANQMQPAIKRITMLSGSTMTLRFGTAHIILVESGSLKIVGTSGKSYSRLPEFAADTVGGTEAKPIVALPGSVTITSDDAPYLVTNQGSQVAHALLIRFSGYVHFREHPVGTSQNDSGVQIEALSDAPVLPPRKGDWTIEVGRATFAPGTSIERHDVAGAELIVVEQGRLSVETDTCEPDCILTVEGIGFTTGEPPEVQAGQGISAGMGASAAYRVAGSAPATLLIVTVAPAPG